MTHPEVQVTPAIAANFLSRDETAPLRQRRVDMIQVRRYAEMMKAGKWQRNGETLKFNGTQLLDGQHRLHAIIEADVTLPFLIVNDIDAASFVTIDQGMPRTVRHLLEMQNYHYTNPVITTARRAFLYLKHKNIYCHSAGNKSKAIDPDVIIEFIVANGRALELATSLAGKCNVGHQSLLATLQFLNRDHPNVEEFFDRLRDGVFIHSKDPIRLLREKLLVNRVGALRRANAVVVMAWCFKAWNAHVRKQPISRLSWNGDRETFPELVEA
jgi:hypothetical protein